MQETQEMLKMKVLLCFLHQEDECTVSGIARVLGREKYAVSRVLVALEKEGLVDRSNNRAPKLTEAGRERAMVIDEKIGISVSHLMYEGVDVATAKEDAFVWALYNSDRTMEVIRNTEIRYHAKNSLRNKTHFNGNALCRQLPDGNYEFPFVIYRGQVKDGSIISMANEGFVHPCVLSVKKHVGTIQLVAQPMVRRSGVTGKAMEGSVSSMKYFDSGDYISAERSGDILSFPADILKFVNIGSGVNQILHGSAYLKMTCTVGTMHMPESKAIFTILI